MLILELVRSTWNMLMSGVLFKVVIAQETCALMKLVNGVLKERRKTMVEMIKGDKSVKMPALVVVAAVITAGACAIASDVCNVISKRK